MKLTEAEVKVRSDNIRQTQQLESSSLRLLSEVEILNSESPYSTKLRFLKPVSFSDKTVSFSDKTVSFSDTFSLGANAVSPTEMLETFSPKTISFPFRTPNT